MYHFVLPADRSKSVRNVLSITGQYLLHVYIKHELTSSFDVISVTWRHLKMLLENMIGNQRIVFRCFRAVLLWLVLITEIFYVFGDSV